MSDWRIPLTDLDYGEKEFSAVQRVLESKWLSLGPEVQQFESEFAEFLGVAHAVAVTSATAALHLAYVALGIEPGDEIVQPALNFVAAANMTVAAGATPVFADIVSHQEPTIDPGEVERLVTSKTRAVVAMHYGGSLSRMSELREVCRAHRLSLIEDACHAIGARYESGVSPDLDEQMAGSLGDAAAFSFFSNKNLATGEGGMFVTNREEIAERARKLRSHGMTSLTWDRHRGHASTYDVSVHGYNYRLDELHAALGRVQLAKLLQNNARRRYLQSLYRKELEGLDGWIVPFGDCQGEPTGHLMVVVAPSHQLRMRAAGALREAGIQTSLHYPCIVDFAAFEAFRESRVPRSRDFSSRALSLPIFPTMTDQQVQEVCSALRAAVSFFER